MPRLLSGRVGVTSFAGLSTTRNQTTADPNKFLGIGDMEPNLGLPADNDYILFGNVDGTRRWDVFTPSGAIDGITILDEGVTPSGFAGSITKVNFQGNGVEVTQIKEQVGNAQVGIATVFINKSTNDLMDSSGFVSIVGVTTFKIGAGLSFVSLPGQTGIASIFNTADAKFTFLDDRGLVSVTNVGQLRIGAGLTVSEPAVGIASISPTGQFEHVNATGIITAAQGFVGNITGNVTGNTNGAHTGSVNGNVTGNLVGNVTGNVTGDLTGDFNAGISSVTELAAGTINATGIITTSTGFVAPVGSFGFNGSLNSTGISTVAFFSGTNIKVSGIATADGGFVAPIGGQGFVGKVTGDVTGDIKSSGVSTTTYLQSTHVNASGIITASNFVGNLTGSVAGAASLITLAAESSDTTCFPIFATAETGDLAPKTDASSLFYNASNGTFSADIFSGSGASLTNIPGGQITGALAAVDGSALTGVIADKVQMNATNSTNATHFITFVDTATGNEDVRTDTNLTYNPGTNILTATTFNGNATGLTGNPTISVGDITLNGNITPDADNIRNLGANTTRFANVHCVDMHAGDCHFSNQDKGGNDVDGTWGDWTLQEGEETLFLLNNRNGKKYKMNLTEV